MSPGVACEPVFFTTHPIPSSSLLIRRKNFNFHTRGHFRGRSLSWWGSYQTK